MSLFIPLLRRRIPIWALLAALALSLGCSDDGTSPESPGNRPPTLVFTVTKRAVPRSTVWVPRYATLSVTADDPDGDPVTVHWEVTRDGKPSGVLNPSQQGQPSIQWQTPEEVGRDTVTVVASDGKGGTTTLVETIQVGTPKTATALYVSETWSSAESPYIVSPSTGDLVVSEKVTLTIEAGSELLVDRPKADRPTTLSVVGRLEATGTAGSPVLIQPNSRKPVAGEWGGIMGNSSGAPAEIILRHTRILYAANAIQANVSTEVFLESCELARSKENALLHESVGTLSVRNSYVIDNFKSGIKIRKLAPPAPRTVTIEGNTIRTNGDVTGQTLYDKDAAIYIELPDTLAEAAITIAANEIRDNGVPGIHLLRYCYPVITDNAIYGNEFGKAGTPYNIKLEKGFGSGGVRDTIDATMNYWGGYYSPSVGDSLIKEMIRDSDDDPAISVRVVVRPWRDVWP